MVIVKVTFGADMGDEGFAQRPLKAFQHEWKDRYSTFLKNARSQSGEAQKEVEASPDYQKLKQDYDTASKNAAPRIKEINERLRDLGAQILAVQNVFTDRRAYVSASTYDIETETSSSAKERKRRNLEEHQQESTTAEMPDGKKKTFKDRSELEKTYNDLKNERTQLSAELGEIIKPVNEKKELMDSFLTDHMVSLTTSQLTGLHHKTEA